MKSFIAIILNTFVKDGRGFSGVGFRKFNCPEGEDPTWYYLNMLDATCELIHIVEADKWVGELSVIDLPNQ